MNGRELSPIGSVPLQAERVSAVEKLDGEAALIRKRLKEIEEALEILREYPKIERLLTILGGHQY